MRRLLTAWVVVAFLTSGLAWAEMRSVKSSVLNFRDGPSTKHRVRFTAERYYPVEVIGRKGGWLQVQDYEGDKAWVLERLLAKDKGVVVKVGKANVRRRPDVSSQILFTASRGAAFKVLKTEGQWVLVRHADGDEGWIHQNLVWGL